MEEQTKPLEPEKTEKMGFISRIAGIFFEPKKVFNYLNYKPSWIFAFILILIIAIIIAEITLPQNLLLQKEIVSQIPRLSSAPPEVLDRMTEVDTGKRISTVVSEVLKNLIGIFLLTSLVYFFCNIILGGESSYKKVLSVATYTSFVPILGAILKTPLILAKNSADVQTSLALLMPEGDFTKIRYLLLAFIDIFAIWQIILIALGMTVLYRFSRGKAFTAAIISWLVVVLLGIGLSVMGMSFAGVPISW